jgi:hypothetical protein
MRHLWIQWQTMLHTGTLNSPPVGCESEIVDGLAIASWFTYQLFFMVILSKKLIFETS